MLRHPFRVTALLLPLLAGLLLQGQARGADIRARFELELAAGESVTAARIRVAQAHGELREIALDGTRLQNIAGDGSLTRSGDRVLWRPPAAGGTLRYQVALSHRRNDQPSGGHDAWVGGRFAVFRGEDAFPIRSWRRLKGHPLAGELAIGRPAGWALVTPYLADRAGHMPIHNPGKRLPRPIGWIEAGDLGTRRDRIEDLDVSVTAPRGLRMERIAMLGLLRWNLPQLLPALAGGSRPKYVSIVAAADPMWLGALSAPNSIFVHADRPLISENATSTILHEMVHVLLADLRTPRDQDWIDEGLAEYLALRALKDSGTISEPRYEATIAEFRRWGAPVRTLRTANASGAVTARAVTVFHDLDIELRSASRGAHSLATLAGGLARDGGLTDVDRLRAAARAIMGRPSGALATSALPGVD